MQVCSSHKGDGKAKQMKFKSDKKNNNKPYRTLRGRWLACLCPYFSQI